MKDVVVRKGFGTDFAHTVDVQSVGLGIPFGKPEHGGNVLLYVGSFVIRGGVQINAVFTKRFPVVGGEEKGGVVFIRQGF